MKIIKTSNYKKIEKQARVSGDVASGAIEFPSGIQIDVEVTFKYTPETPDVPYLRNGDPGYPGSGPEWDIISVTDETGRLLSDDEIDMYSDQIDRIIINWSQDPNNFDDGSDDKYDQWKDDQLGW